MKKKGFTLFEVCGAILGIILLVGFALMNFMDALEKAKADQAINCLMSVRYAQTWYKNKNQKFCAEIEGLDGWGLPLAELRQDPDWKYKMSDAGAAEFTVEAQRTKGPYQGMKILLDHKGGIIVPEKARPWAID